MPPAKRSTRSASRVRTFKEPAALKRLTKSLDTAQSALAELSKQGGRDVGKGAGDVYKDLRTFLSNARRDTGRLGKSLARDFEQAQKALAKSNASSSRRTASTGGRTGRASSSSRRSSTSTSTGATKRSSSTSATKRSSSTSRTKRSSPAAKTRSRRAS